MNECNETVIHDIDTIYRRTDYPIVDELERQLQETLRCLEKIIPTVDDPALLLKRIESSLRALRPPEPPVIVESLNDHYRQFCGLWNNIDKCDLKKRKRMAKGDSAFDKHFQRSERSVLQKSNN